MNCPSGMAHTHTLWNIGAMGGLLSVSKWDATVAWGSCAIVALLLLRYWPLDKSEISVGSEVIAETGPSLQWKLGTTSNPDCRSVAGGEAGHDVSCPYGR